MLSYDLAKNVGVGTGTGLAGLQPVTDGLWGMKQACIRVIVNAAGATPALSFQVEATVDGTNWEKVALLQIDSTVAASSAAQAVTSPAAGVVTTRYIDGLDKRIYKGIRINPTANTNVTDWSAQLIRSDHR